MWGVNCFLYTPLHAQHKRGVLGEPWLDRENDRGRRLGPVLELTFEEGDILLPGACLMWAVLRLSTNKLSLLEGGSGCC